MIELPDGYDHALRTGATGSVDPESGPRNSFWRDPEDVRDALRAYRQIQDECKPREPRRRERKAER